MIQKRRTLYELSVCCSALRYVTFPLVHLSVASFHFVSSSFNVNVATLQCIIRFSRRRTVLRVVFILQEYRRDTSGYRTTIDRTSIDATIAATPQHSAEMIHPPPTTLFSVCLLSLFGLFWYCRVQ